MLNVGRGQTMKHTEGLRSERLTCANALGISRKACPVPLPWIFPTTNLISQKEEKRRASDKPWMDLW